MNKTSIEWTDFTWNPIRANLKGARGPRPHTGTFCTRVSPGCTNCYASVINKRFGNGLEYTVPNLERVEFFIDEKILAEPLRRKKPARIFVADMFDLFHEAIPPEFIAEVLRVALKIPRHTFQFLTKRAERMRDLVNRAQEHWGVKFGQHMHFGVSVEDQQRADERIPLLLQTPAAVRFLSVEPQLEEIDIRAYLATGLIHLVIDGGESGTSARRFNLAWAESLLGQCKAAGVPFFMKQIGSKPEPYGWRFSQGVRDRKGGDPAEWPESLRVREFPKAAVAEEAR